MKPPAQASDLKHRVRFDTKIITDDPAGGSLERWTTVGSGSFIRQAKIIPMRGGEGVQGQRLQGTQPAILIVRADSETKLIDPSWRAVLLLNGNAVRAFGLKTAFDMEMDNRFITFLTVAGEADSEGDTFPPGLLDFSSPLSSDLLALFEDI